MYKNEGLKTFGKLIAPSLLELLSVFFIFVIFFIADQIHQLYSKNLTTLGVSTFKGTFLSGLAHWLSSLYNSKGFSTIGVYIFWLLIALIVYVMAISFTNNAEEMVEDVKIRHYLWPRGTSRNSPIKEYFEKFGMKLIILVALCLYLIRLSPPLFNWWKVHYAPATVSLHSLKVYVILLIFVTLYIHGLVVLIRALILRLRIINI
jgi:hypothetical protein